MTGGCLVSIQDFLLNCKFLKVQLVNEYFRLIKFSKFKILTSKMPGSQSVCEDIVWGVLDIPQKGILTYPTDRPLATYPQ